MVGALLAYLMYAYLARNLTPDNFGVFCYCARFVLLLGILFAFGYPISSMRFLTIYREKNERDKIKYFMRQAYKDIFLFSSLLIIVIIVSLLSIESYFPRIYRIPLIIGLSIAPVLAFVRLNERILLSLRQTSRSQAPDSLFRPVIIILFIFISVHLGVRPSANVTLAAFGFSLMVVLFLQVVWLRSKVISRGPQKPHWSLRKSWRYTSRHLFLFSISNAVLAFGDVLLIGLFLRPEVVALYVAVSKIVYFGQALKEVMYQQVGLQIAPMYDENAQQDLKNLLNSAVLVTSLVLAFLLVVFIFLGKSVLGVFGSYYQSGYHFMLLMLTAQLISALFGPVNQLLNMTGQERISAQISLVLVAMQCLCFVTLVPLMGLHGAAIAYSIFAVGRSMVVYYFVRRTTGVDTIPLACLTREKR
jgi:O-antigen/teichoic acid export membrane protein